MPITGADIARAALRAIGALDPTEEGDAEDIVDAIAIGSRMLDGWRNDDLTVSGTTRSPYGLQTGVQSYTTGSGGVFDQVYPNAILRWGVIPDGGASTPVEKRMGRPLTMLEWGEIQVKTLTAAYPTKLAWDERFDAGLGRILVWPIPLTSAPDIVLYQRIPSIVSLVEATSYTLQPGGEIAVVTNLARELALTGGYDVPADTLARVVNRADYWLARLKNKNYRPKTAAINPAFANLGRGRRYNVRTDA